MKCKALFIFFLLPGLMDAQNLVPNGSFEDYISCPEHLDGLEFTEHWYKSIIYPDLDYYLNPSPDYYHECALSPTIGVPDNIQGSQMAHEGLAYCGLFTYDNVWSDAREIIGVSLTSPLKPGQTYYCSMYFVRPVGWSLVGVATNNLGMKFSNSDLFTSTAQALDGVVHLKVEEVAIDSVNWVLLYGEIVPDQSYQYLHIGNFFTDEDTDIQFFSETSRWGYYFIDDVRVSAEPLIVTSNNTKETSHDIMVFPNPVAEVLNFVSQRKVRNVKFYNISGKLIDEFEVGIKDKFSLNVEHISKGLYVAMVYFDNGAVESVKINKN